MTWEDMKTEALKELRSRDDIGTRLEGWLRAAYLEIYLGYRFYETESSASFTLVAGESEKTFAAAGLTAILKHVFSLRDTTNKKKLLKASFRWMDKREIRNGPPTHYARFGQSFLFDAAPLVNTVIKVRFRKQIAEPVFSGTVYPETPTEWDEIIRLKGVAKGFDALFEPDMALQKEEQVKQIIDGLAIDEFMETEDDEFGLTPREA